VGEVALAAVVVDFAITDFNAERCIGSKKRRKSLFSLLV